MIAICIYSNFFFARFLLNADLSFHSLCTDVVTRNRQAKSKVNLKFVFCALCHLEFNADFLSTAMLQEKAFCRVIELGPY